MLLYSWITEDELVAEFRALKGKVKIRDDYDYKALGEERLDFLKRLNSSSFESNNIRNF